MKVEVVKKPVRLSKSNACWLQIQEQFFSLKDDECLKIKELGTREINSLRQQAYREEGARCFVRKENSKLVLYLYKRNKGGNN